MSYTVVLDTELGGAPLVEATQEAFGDAMVFEDSVEDDGKVTHRWRAAEGEDAIALVEDEALNLVYAVTTSSAWRAEIATAFGCFSAAEIREVIGGDLETEHVRLPMLALCNSGTFDPETERLLIAASRHARAEVRLSATEVMTTLGWPALRAQMFAMQSERDPRVVRVLQRAAAVWSARARAEKENAAKHLPMKKSFRKELWAARQGGGKGRR